MVRAYRSAPSPSPAPSSTVAVTTTLIDVVLNLALLGMVVYLFVALKRLEGTGCPCAMGGKRKFIMVYLALRAVTILTNMLIFNPAARSWMTAISVALFPLDIVFAVLTLQYVHELSHQKCTCAPNAMVSILRAYAIIVAITVAILFLLMGTVVQRLYAMKPNHV
jgi:hypothetical protein